MSEALKSISSILKDIVDKLEEQHLNQGERCFGDTVNGSAYITRRDLAEDINDVRDIVNGFGSLDLGVYKEKGTSKFPSSSESWPARSVVRFV